MLKTAKTIIFLLSVNTEHSVHVLGGPDQQAGELGGHSGCPPGGPQSQGRCPADHDEPHRGRGRQLCHPHGEGQTDGGYEEGEG